MRGKLIIFDGHYRNKEIDIYFAVNPKQDILQNLVYSRFLPGGEPYNGTTLSDSGKTLPEKIYERLEIHDALIGIQTKNHFTINEEKSTRVNLTIEDCENNEDLEGRCLDITIQALPHHNITVSPETSIEVNFSKIFPSKMRLRLKSASLSSYMDKISNYSFLMTMVIILSFFIMLGVIKKVSDNHSLAQSISPISIGLNLIWNFFYFAIHFQFSIQGEGEFMQYLGLPAFWFFISSFTFESRLFIIVWRAQLN